MWRRKALAVAMACLTAGCSAIQERRSAQPAGPAARQSTEIELVGCLLAGTAPGTFVLADVTNAGSAAPAVDVMSTRIGLTAFVGRRVGVRGQEEDAPRRSIIEVGTVFRIRALEVMGACEDAE